MNKAINRRQFKNKSPIAIPLIIATVGLLAEAYSLMISRLNFIYVLFIFSYVN